MSPLVGSNPAYPTSEYPTSGKVYVYDLKFEVSVETGVEKVAVNAIFADFLKRVGDVADNAVVVRDTKGNRVVVGQPIDGATFQDNFGVQTVEGKDRKVMLGFVLETRNPMSTLKWRMMDYLKEKKLFLRVHSGGFANGLRTSFLGFMKDENPATADVSALKHKILNSMTEMWLHTDWINDTDRALMIAEFGDHLKDDKITFPLIIGKNKLIADNPTGKRVETYGLAISTPIAFFKPVKALLDSVIHATISGISIPGLIPIGLRRENPELYYKIMSQQAKFIHEHRNIQIGPVKSAHLDADIQPGITLRGLLEKHPDIHRVYYDASKERFHVSTNTAKYTSVQEWIDEALDQNPFAIRRITTSSSTRSMASKYSQLFTTTSSLGSDSFDPSTIQTVKTKTNAWIKNPPMRIEYSATADAFPPLPSKSHAQDTQTTASSTRADLSTLTSQIDDALRKLETEYQEKIDTMTQVMDQRIAALEKTMADMVTTIVEKTYTSLLREDSPIASKYDHLLLSNDVKSVHTKLDALLTMLQPPSHSTDSALSPSRPGKRANISKTPEKPAPADDDSPSDLFGLSTRLDTLMEDPNNLSSTSNHRHSSMIEGEH
jgi:hypothetical protein